MSAIEPLAPADAELLERLATRVVELRLETPAILTIESARPMAFLTGQAMVFFEPLVQMLFRLPDYRRYAALIERREALEFLTQAIESRADARVRSPRPDPTPRTPDR